MVTNEDFIKKFGINLELRFQGKKYDTIENASQILLNLVEELILDYIQKNSAYIFLEFNELQTEAIKQAILWQTYYVIQNGELFNDSGYDIEKGIIATDLEDIVISPRALDKLINSGLLNRSLGSDIRYGNFTKWR